MESTTKNQAAQALRAIPSVKRDAASRANGKRGGRPRKGQRTYYAAISSVRDDGTVDEWCVETRRPDRAHTMRDRDERILSVRASTTEEARELLTAIRQGHPISEDVL